MDRSIRFLLNDQYVSTSLPAGLVTLDYLRQERRLTGTREGCREGDCGACAVLLGESAVEGVLYRTVNSCLLPLGAVEGRHLVTIEGLNPRGADPPAHPDGTEGPRPPGSALPPLSAVQECFLVEGASQCGFCTPGFVISLTGYLLRTPRASLAGALDAVAGNICRCTGYASIRRAVARVLDHVQAGSVASGGEGGAGGDGEIEAGRLALLVELGVVPRYFLEVPERLRGLREGEAAGQAAAGAAGAPAGPSILVAGGTDLFVQRPEELARGALRLLSRERGLSGMRREEGRLVIGAATTMEELQILPELAQSLAPAAAALQWLASSPIRQRATVGGNLVNASPIGDLSVLFLALGAQMGLHSVRGSREIPLESFYRGYKQLDLAEGELVEWIAITPPGADAVLSFEKVARRKHLDIASVNSAACLRIDRTRGDRGAASSGGSGSGRSGRGPGRILEARLAAGGVAPVPLFLARTSAYLTGREATPDTVRAALDAAQEETAPISDVRGSTAYKRLALRQLLIAQFLGAFPEELAGEDWR
ncbi:MAG: FAD binding domain-containing protein [Spirochaetales bacterium]|nr:FAD binding domain-containing protein [Spirochaetales bacterium]